MIRSVIGKWGEGLDATKLAQAIAALGVLVGDYQDAPMEVARDPQTVARMLRTIWAKHPDRLRFGGHNPAPWRALKRRLPPEIAADAWKGLLDDRPSGPTDLNLIVISQHMDDREAADCFAWLSALLGQREVGIDGLFFERWLNTKEPRPQPGRITWHWPIRLGFLSGPTFPDIREQIDQGKPSWFDRLTRMIDVKITGEGCDILISPHSLAETSKRIEQLALRATAVLLVEQPAFTSKSEAVALQRLFAVAEASGIAMLRCDGDYGMLLHNLVREISHDLTLDGAFAFAVRYHIDGQPLVVAERQFIERTQIGDIAEALARRFEARDMIDIAGAARSLARGAYASEGDTASDLADLVAEHAPALQAPEPRYLQVEAWLLNQYSSEVSRAPYFVRDHPHLLDVHIAPLAEGEISTLDTFPDQDIDWRGGPQELDVVITAPGCRVAWSRLRDRGRIERGTLDRGDTAYLRAALHAAAADAERSELETATASLRIDPTGPSDRVRFVLIPKSAEQVRARLLVVHANRILQTAILDGPIEERSPIDIEPTSADEDMPPSSISLQPEGMVRTALEELDERRRFDIALLTNDSLTGGAQITAIADEHVMLRDFGQLDEIAPRIRQDLMRIVEAPEVFDGVDSPDLLDLLRSLARQGVLLHRYFKDAGLSPFLADAGDRLKRLQLVAANPEEALPLEFIYDGRAPRPTAELCPNRQDALESGSCGDCPNRRSKDFVCPMRFWGFRHVIERQLFSPEAAPEKSRVSRGEPILERSFLPRPTTSLFAQSARAERFPESADAISMLASGLQAASEDFSVAVQDWQTWEDQVEALSPTLLVLLPHTDLTPAEGEVLEIGQADRIANADIDEHIVGKHNQPVTALLLGCDTGDQQVRYASFVAQFRHAGCAIVIGTLTPILGRHAVPIAEAIVAECYRLWCRPEAEATLGDVMAAMRRRFMADGLPAGLALIAHGDADWRLGGCQDV